MSSLYSHWWYEMHKVGELPVEKFMRRRFSRVATNDDIKEVVRILLRGDTSVVAVFYRNKFVGEIHELDLLKLAVDPRKIPKEEVITLGVGVDMGYFAKTAGDIVRRHEIKISPETKIKDACFTMLKSGVRAIPVMKDNKLLGIVMERDILKKIVKRRLEK
jgi:predicted transcriptional regulator